MTDNQDFDALLEQSSLGSPAARRLRERTPVERAAAIRRITKLRNIIAHSSGAKAENAVKELAEVLRAISDGTPDALRQRADHPDYPEGTSVQHQQAVSLSVQVEVADEVLADLRDWLRADGLQAGITAVSPEPLGTQGVADGALSVSARNPGELIALASALAGYLAYRHVRMTVRTLDGRNVEIDSRRADDVDALLLDVLGPVAEGR